MWLHTKNKKPDELKDYICSNYKILGYYLQNSLLGKLYSGTDKNWFDIENTYFKELVEIKNKATRSTAKEFNYGPLRVLNKEFSEIKKEVLNYLRKIEITVDKEILQFLIKHFQNVGNVYFINFKLYQHLKVLRRQK